MHARLLLPALAVLLLMCGSGRAETDPAGSTFEQHVRPILKAHCFQCHGEDGQKEGSLDLRLQRFMLHGGDSGPAIEPGRPDDSYLLDRVRSGEMPPGDKQLTSAEILTIREWIAAGARTARPEPEEIGDAPLFTQEERDYWAFQPIRRPPVPSIQDADRARTPIDAFILARLEREGLTFSADADRRTLIRRASFDLIGLPPTPEEIGTFLAEDSANAWEKLIDRLLSSPHYGERWGRHWLDVAGYADSEGYTDEDTPRPWAFRYRDYVIRAWNADKPFDLFIQEQLAGDEMIAPPYANLSPEGVEKLAATGFLRMAPDGTGNGGVDQPVARNQVIADTIDIVATSLLGLTVACAQCHDHRYDPIPHADYYRLRAVFEPALDWKNWRVPRARQISLYTDVDRELARQINAEAAQVDAERLQKQQEYINRTLEEELLLVEEENREALRTAYKLPAKERSAEQQALLKEHPSVANISAGSLYLYDRRRDEKAARLDAERKKKETQYVSETLQRELEKVSDEEREAVKLALAGGVEKRTDEQSALLSKYPGVQVTLATLEQFNAEAAAELKQLTETAAELRATKTADNLKQYADRAAEIRARIPQEGFIRALAEVPGKASETFVFFRGDHDQPKQQVPPGDLSILADVTSTEIASDDPDLPTTGRRLAFARHLTDGSHPLTPRVIVNRIWLQHFGRGFVNSPGDFGVLGEPPSHPELLDWLAADFVENGWSIKRLHRMIMTSTAYRQSSRRASEHDSDPENRLYARMSIRRLESEVVRDAVLSVSGRFNAKMYGEPIPVMEDDVGQIVLGKENLDGERKPVETGSLGGEEFRRSLYVQVRRSRPLAVLETFDAPAMDPNCECRNASTVAPQSLLLMNSRFALEFAGHFARRVIAEAGTQPRAQAARAWLLAFGSGPGEEELAAAERFLVEQHSVFTAQSPGAEAGIVEHKSLTTFCQALLSANAFLYVD